MGAHRRTNSRLDIRTFVLYHWRSSALHSSHASAACWSHMITPFIAFDSSLTALLPRHSKIRVCGQTATPYLGGPSSTPPHMPVFVFLVVSESDMAARAFADSYYNKNLPTPSRKALQGLEAHSIFRIGRPSMQVVYSSRPALSPSVLSLSPSLRWGNHSFLIRTRQAFSPSTISPSDQ